MKCVIGKLNKSEQKEIKSTNVGISVQGEMSEICVHII